MRYIDVDALIKKIFPYDVVDKKDYSINAEAIYKAIENAPTEDVVPRAEVEELNNLVEILNARNDDLFEENERLLRTGCQAIKQAKQEFAKQIFGEIDNIIYQYLNNRDYSGGNMVYDLTELGMKYIGEEK